VLGEILEEMGIPLIEQNIQTYDVVNAEEAWLPTTPYCLGPVTRFNGLPIGDGQPGPMWRKILDRWSELVGKDIFREVTESQQLA
jgi:branched-chain amino acid aminotransferase